MEFDADRPKLPEEVFPLVVWVQIFDNLETASDLKSCYQTCKSWVDLLKPKRTNFLMPDVFPILCKYVGYEKHRPKPYLCPEEVLKLRLVCKSWKESLDRFYQHHPRINSIDWLERPYPNFKPFPFNQYEFNEEGDGLERLERFLAKDFPLNSNPFIARYIYCYDNVRVYDFEVPPRREFPVSFIRLLESFGSQIWICNLYFKWVTVNRAGIYRAVRRQLSLMPNLQSLTVTVDDHQCFNRFERKLERLLKTQPLPELKQLRKLEMISVPYPLSVGLVASNKQLQTLSLSDPRCDVLPDEVVRVNSENLKFLLLRGCGVSHIVKLQSVTWPLEVLHLGVSCAKLDYVFQAVAVFSNTLKELFIRYRNTSDKYKDNNLDLQTMRLKLPKLKKFKLKTPFKLKTIDFLAGCTELRVIDLYIGITEESDDDDNTNPITEDKEEGNVDDSLNNENIAEIADEQEVGDDTDSCNEEDGTNDSGNEEETDVNYCGDEQDSNSYESYEDEKGSNSDDSCGEEKVANFSGDENVALQVADCSGDENVALQVADCSGDENVALQVADCSGDENFALQVADCSGDEINTSSDDLYGYEEVADLSGDENVADFSGTEKVDDLSGEEKVADFSGDEKVANFSGTEKVADLSGDEGGGNLADSSGNEEERYYGDFSGDEGSVSYSEDGNSDESSTSEDYFSLDKFLAADKAREIPDTFGHEDASASVIQFYNYMTSMERSNIWQVLPMLSFVGIDTTTRNKIDSDDLPESVNWATRNGNVNYIQKVNAEEMERASSPNAI